MTGVDGQARAGGSSPLRASVAFTGAAARRAGAAGATAVVIDVVRATTCIVEAMAHGACSVAPFAAVGDAAASARAAARAGEDVALCGEQGGLRIDGFDLGNSPREFSPDAVAGKHLFMKTTNGTDAFLAVAEAKRVLAAAFVNMNAVASRLADDGADVLVVCAGKDGAFALDDAVCAGHVLRSLEAKLAREGRALALDDGAEAARDLAGARGVSAEMLAATAAGKALARVGLADDLAVCSDADRHAVVPEVRGGAIVAVAPEAPCGGAGAA